MPNFARLKFSTPGKAYLVDAQSTDEVRTAVQQLKHEPWADDLTSVQVNSITIPRRTTDNSSAPLSFEGTQPPQPTESEIHEALRHPDLLATDCVLAILVERWLNADEFVSA
ncbi:MAG TPA: hypothetical protein VMF91_04815 [Bryobacteraceae bacterium]|nr:hypothetical protein [Bryobacteraceae bacterium]